MDSILIIDDEPQIRKLLSRMMELEGYEVFQAADCQSTLKQLKLRVFAGRQWSGYGYNHQKTLSRIGGDTFDRPR